MQPDRLTISKTEIAEMPRVTFSGEITVIETEEAGVKALSALESVGQVGFDTETRPSFHKGQVNKVALVQISTADHSYLFRVNKTGIFPALKSFLESDRVVKIGLSIKDDFKVLSRVEVLSPRGFVDLQSEVTAYNIGEGSLRKIYAIIFGERISKSQRLTNWEADALTHSQCEYASIDAWACLRIYRTLHAGKFDPDACFGHYHDTTEIAKL